MDKYLEVAKLQQREYLLRVYGILVAKNADDALHAPDVVRYAADGRPRAAYRFAKARH